MDNIPPILNGTWYYPDSINPSIEYNFRNGKNHGKHILYDRIGNREEIKFYNENKLDSVYFFYSNNKLSKSFHSPISHERYDSLNYYYYENDQLNKIIIFHGQNRETDTIHVSNSN